MSTFPDFSIERSYWDDGYTIIGIDEVGRGSLAGPIGVGAVCFSPDMVSMVQDLGIQDSKLLSSKKRIQLMRVIKNKSTFSDMSFVDVDHINQKGIVSALKTAIGLAVQKSLLRLQNKKIILLIDGQSLDHIPYTNDIERVSIIKGDRKSISIAAASIMAKVERDAYMEILSQKFREYFWEKNKGYGTKAHREAIQKFGLTPHHRTLFVRKILSP